MAKYFFCFCNFQVEGKGGVDKFWWELIQETFVQLLVKIWSDLVKTEKSWFFGVLVRPVMLIFEYAWSAPNDELENKMRWIGLLFNCTF